MDARLSDLLAGAVEELGAGAAIRLPSGAGHDAMSLARVVPTALVFIPCRDGVSHTPDEYSSPDQVVRGCDALLGAVLERASRA